MYIRNWTVYHERNKIGAILHTTRHVVNVQIEFNLTCNVMRELTLNLLHIKGPICKALQTKKAFLLLGSLKLPVVRGIC